MEIAIIGMACRFPDATNYNEYWENLKNGVNSIKEITPDRWDNRTYYSTSHSDPNKSISKWCGLVNDIDKFDNRFFQISPREAKNMDPQQRLLLEEAWHCIEDSGVSVQELQKKTTSVYVGVMGRDHLQQSSAHPTTDSYAALGNYDCILSNRISYMFGLTGASVSLDAACASSLVAIHTARQTLSTGDCDYAIAAGVSLNLHPWKYLSFSKSRMLSPDGQCKTFDKDANGYVPGEGVGVVLLQPLEKALRKGNKIYGVIKGSAIGHGGSTPSITAPSVEAQKNVILDAYKDANISAGSVSYVEAHGTGTSLGDPIEVEALNKAFGHFTDKKQFCHIGSVKTNIGHLEAAAGIAGVIKVLMMMKHRKIAPTINLKTPNPIIDFYDSPFKLAGNLCEWPDDPVNDPLRASISSFGFGGVNSHILLEESPKRDEQLFIPGEKKGNENVSLPFLLSAKSPKSLKKQLDKWTSFIKTPDCNENSFEEICQTLMLGRQAFDYRLGWIVNSREAIADVLSNQKYDENELKRLAPDTTWHLVLGDSKWENYDQLKFVLEGSPVFQQIADDTLTEIEAALNLQNIKNEFKKPVWAQDDRPLFSFVADVVISRGLILLGLVPSTVTYENTGLWAALTISKMCSVSAVAAVLKNKTPVKQLILKRPELDFFDNCNQVRISPILLSSDYLTEIRDCIVVTEEEYQHYLAEARLLKNNQFTFKKYLEEWNKGLETFGFTIDQLLDHTPQYSESSGTILLIAITSSLNQLYKKWDLSRPLKIEDRCFHELLSLLTDDVISKTQVCDLLLSEDPDLNALSSLLKTDKIRTGNHGNYPLLMSQNSLVPEIDDLPSWVDQGVKSKCVYKPDGKYHGVYLGASKHFISDQENIVFDFKSQSDRNVPTALLELWNRGCDIDWSVWFGTSEYGKAALPTYSFDQKSFRLVEVNSDKTDRTKSLQLGTEKEKPVTSGAVGNHLSPCHTTFLPKDHIVNNHIITGKTIVPASALIELVSGGLSKKGSSPVWAMKNFILQHPAIVDTSLSITLKNDENRFSLQSSDKVFGQGVVEFGEPSGDFFLPETEADSCFEELPTQGLYDQLFKIGYQYGPELQIIRQIKKGRNAYCFNIKTSQVPESSPSGCCPFIIDGAFQAVLSTGYVFEKQLESDNTLYLPYIIGRITQYGEIGKQCRMILEKKDLTLENGDLCASFKLFNKDGQVVLHVEKMIFKKVQNQFVNPEFGKEVEIQQRKITTYQPVWIQQQLNLKPDTTPGAGALVICDNSDLSHQMSDDLNQYYSEVEVICRSNDLISPEETSGDYTDPLLTRYINVIKGFLNTLASRSKSIDIYYMCQNQPTVSGDIADIEIKSVYDLLKTISDLKLKNQIRISFITPGTQVVESGDKGKGHAWGFLDGLGQTIKKELPNIGIKILDLDDSQSVSPEIIPFIVTETQANQEHVNIAFRAGKRMVKSYSPVTEVANGENRYLNDKAIYIILGGAGGIGLKLVKHLTRITDATFFIIGRSVLNAERSEVLKALQNGKNNVVYVKADISKRTHVEKIVRVIQSQYGEINGIIQMAGALNDRLFVSKKWEDFRSTLYPKIDGTLWFYEALKNNNLDFFVTFSSIVTVSGNPGQADYAAGNSFLDSFAQHIRKEGCFKKCLNINWTLWDDGGMGQSARQNSLFADKVGIISSDDAFQVFDLLMSQFEGQYIVAGKEIEFAKVENHKTAGQVPEISEDKKNTAGIIQNGGSIQDRLVELLAELIEIEEFELDKSVDLREFGLESITYTEYAECICDEFDVNINPTIFYEYPTIDALTEYLVENFDLELLNEEVGAVSFGRDDHLILEESIPVSGQAEDMMPSMSQDQISIQLTELLSEVIETDVCELKPETDLREFGLESITYTEYSESINDHFDISINPTIFYEYPTIRALSDHLLKTCDLGNIEDRKTEETEHITIAEDDIEIQAVKESERLPEKTILIQDTHAEADTPISANQNGDIAIIGMSGRFPGAEDPEEFWENLIENRDQISEIPKDRWIWEDYYGDPQQESNKTNCKWGGFLKDVTSLDADFFNISPKEAELMDPQQRLLLEEVWHTLEDAGYSPSLMTRKTGVFIGVCNDDYNELLQTHNITQESYTSTGSYFSIIPNRISYLLNLNGPSIAIDTACSSSLVAIHQAVQSIHNGDCQMALAGGVNLCLTPRRYLSFSHAGMLSKEGRCKTFDEKADGYVRGEGVGVVLLKPLEKAVGDRDHIYGVIKGSAVNHGGFANSLTAPNPNAQADLIETAYKRANITPETVSYIEAHGTGTSLGDPIEINGLKLAFSRFNGNNKNGTDSGHCGIGSVKTHIGHLESAAGIAGIIKVLLAMKNRKLPANLNFNHLNPYIDLRNTPFYILENNQYWEHLKNGSNQPVPRRAGVSSFGFGGVNSHIILEEFARNTEPVTRPQSDHYLLVLSAKNRARLLAYAMRVKRFIENLKGESALPALNNIIYTLQVGREVMDERLAIITSGPDELLKQLECVVDGKKEIKGVSMASSNRKNALISIFNNEFEAKMLVDKWLKTGNLQVLAKLWTSGVSINWDRLPQNRFAQKVPVPKYPFARKQFWLPVEEQKETGNELKDLYEPSDTVHITENKVGDDVQVKLRMFIANMLKMSENDLDPDKDLKLYGFDSLSGMKLVNNIQEIFDTRITMKQIIENASINKISECILAERKTGESNPSVVN